MQYIFERIYRKRKQPRFYMKTPSYKETANFTNNLDLALKVDEKRKNYVIRSIRSFFKIKVRALELERNESGEIKLRK